ncbi:toxin-antitoxin system YwqK family antitoxin [Hymenobacter sp. 102]|uniref:toxin-antitoxin system YwqK family antitoxin n=1 Tax=Hymenobacter sp. 102 TaxID=3403152 RepID=UPI003CEABF9A
MHFTAKSRFFTYLRVSCLAAGLTISISTSYAQTTTTPPARTYFKDEYGRETKMVKERWGEDENGEKHGKYILYSEGDMYSTAGQVMKNSTYVHGAETGPAYYIGDLSANFRYNANKFSGTFTNGIRTGVWSVYERLNGNKLVEKQWYNDNGELIKKTFYKDGKLTGTIPYLNNLRNGPAKLYGNSEAEYASGSFEKDAPIGTWTDATMASSGKAIIYKKGHKVLFEQGKPVALIDAAGKTTPYTQVLAKQEQAKQTAVAEALDAALKPINPDFFTMSASEETDFAGKAYRTPKGVMVGADLLKSGMLAEKYETVPKIIEANTEAGRLTLLLKVLYKVNGNTTPMRALLKDPYFSDPTAQALAALHVPRVDAEMIYFALRGVGSEKGMDAISVQKVIKGLSGAGDLYKTALNRRFDAVCTNEKEYAGLSLRQWLYEEFMGKSPYLWMNYITKNDPDDVNRPEGAQKPQN